MYQDLIRNELNEAAETLANFLQDEANTMLSSVPLSCWRIALRRVGKCCPAVMAVPIAMRCILRKS